MPGGEEILTLISLTPAGANNSFDAVILAIAESLTLNE